MTRPIQEVLSVEAVKEALAKHPELALRTGVWCEEDGLSGVFCACPASAAAVGAGVRAQDLADSNHPIDMIAEAFGLDWHELHAFATGVDGGGEFGWTLAQMVAYEHGKAVREALGLGEAGTK